MHARDLTELAAVVAAHGPVLVGGTQPPSAGGIEEYWVASKCRLNRWAKTLKRPVHRAKRQRPRRDGDGLHGVCEEVITGEMLTRVWTAVLCLWDRRHGTDVAEPVARSVLVGHLEARHRVLTLLVHGPGLDTETAVKLNQLRRRTERWTDMLIGYLTGLGEVADLAVEPGRARDFAEDLCYRSELPGGRAVWPTLHASLRAAFSKGHEQPSPNADLNAKIASSVLACFPAELFDSIGLFRSVWLLRLTHLADDAQGLVDELLSPATPGRRCPRTDAEVTRLAERLRRFGG